MTIGQRPSTPFLSLDQITHRFGPSLALDDVSLDVEAGQVHALLGENGAGKSTLMRVAFGLLKPDAGRVALDGEPRRLRSPHHARALGVGMVHQHFSSIAALSVAENVALVAGWRESGRALIARTEATIARLRLPLDPRARAGALTAQLRQRLEIVQALASDARILLLDEPTAVLAPSEVDELLTMVRGFADAGGAVVLISHKLAEVTAVADRITVLRRGRVVMRGESGPFDHAALSRAMIGPGADIEAQQSVAVGSRATEAPVLQIGGIALHRGEVVGVAAVEGNGQRGLLRGIAGVEPLPSTLRVVAHGDVALVPEDRTTEALIGAFSLAENLLLGNLDRTPRWIDWASAERETARLIGDYEVRADGPSTRAGTLSGGNQQRFVVGRALVRGAAILVAEDPTRGLDVHATAEVHRRLIDAARGGCCVVVHSSDLDEVLSLADRLLVMRLGGVRELPRDTPRAAVGDAMLGLA